MRTINGVLYEEIKFNSGCSGWYESSKAHKVIYYCFMNGLNSNSFTTFENVYYKLTN